MCLVVFFAFWFCLLVLQLRQERVELTAKCCKLEDLNSKFKDLSWKLYIDLRNVDANSKCMGGDSGLSDDSTDSRSCNSEYAPSADGEESSCNGTDSDRCNSETTRSSTDDDESVCRSDTMTNDDSPGRAKIHEFAMLCGDSHGAAKIHDCKAATEWAKCDKKRQRCLGAGKAGANGRRSPQSSLIPESLTLYLGNVSWKATPYHLKKAFRRSLNIKVDTAVIARSSNGLSRGCAFVTVKWRDFFQFDGEFNAKTGQEWARNLCTIMSRESILGRKIYVEVAKQQRR